VATIVALAKDCAIDVERDTTVPAERRHSA
jgi:hypothetical protein